MHNSRQKCALHNASAHINVSATPTSDAANSSSTIGSLGVGSYILQALAESTDTGLTTSTPSTPDPSTVTATDATDTATLAMSASDEPVSVAPLGDPVVMSTDVFTKTVNLHGHPEAVSQAHQCWSDLLTWSSQSYSWYSSNVYNRTFSFTTTTMTPLISTSWTSTFYPSDVSVYTLCDGSPRADIRPWTTSSTYNVTGTPYSYSSLSTPTYTVAQPCIPSEQDCHIWYADSSIPDVNERALENQCGNPAHGPDGDCVFGVEGGVQLIYFPVSTVGGDLCTGNGTTIYPPPRMLNHLERCQPAAGYSDRRQGPFPCVVDLQVRRTSTRQLLVRPSHSFARTFSSGFYYSAWATFPTTVAAAPQSSPTGTPASATALADQVPSNTPRQSSRSASTDTSTEEPPAAESTTTMAALTPDVVALSENSLLSAVTSDANALSKNNILSAVEVDNGVITLGSTTLTVSGIPKIPQGTTNARNTGAALSSVGPPAAVSAQKDLPQVLVIDGNTLSAGGAAATIAGQIPTKASDGLFLVGQATGSFPGVVETLPTVVVPGGSSGTGDVVGTEVGKTSSPASNDESAALRLLPVDFDMAAGSMDVVRQR
ncbi:uncharacterized protein MYCGRDRAFT_97069 [Zymoseptoria tritici IPO323]|uniref:Uncharacterized protein n=1 Tax=Zymoseptoria tritici (strain CBS 115943 / IPO323) TaxID=336722 RepID=F9XNT3_ZYMTI|nr:uncharacterized protein MYCGRDRAFT_97069 [Zymoseptoria tritici IPO323]EGP82929.1 hypothetical protein MYCGRDRAFT_97069 [Zymoseptoria tritici IPO323]